MRIQQTILMKYHALILLEIRKDVKFVVCCSRDWCFKGLIIGFSLVKQEFESGSPG